MKKLILALFLLPVFCTAQVTRTEFNRMAVISGETKSLYEKKTVIFFDVAKSTIDVYNPKQSHFDIISIYEVSDGFNFSCVDSDNSICMISLNRDPNDGTLLATVVFVDIDLSLCFYSY